MLMRFAITDFKILCSAVLPRVRKLHSKLIGTRRRFASLQNRILKLFRKTSKWDDDVVSVKSWLDFRLLISMSGKKDLAYKKFVDTLAIAKFFEKF